MTDRDATEPPGGHPPSSGASGPSGNGNPATIVLVRRVRPGREVLFEELLRKLTDTGLASVNLTVTVLRPAAGVPPVYTIILQFQTQADLDLWNASAEKARLLAEMSRLVRGEPHLESFTGMEAWFTPPAGATSAPPRWKMALLTWAVIVPLIEIQIYVLLPVLWFLPPALRPVPATALVVFLMTYLIMPTATRAFRRWLFSEPTLQDATR